MNKTTRCLLWCLLLGLIGTGAFAQEKRTVSGTVKGEKGEPLQGVSITAKGGPTLTATNAEGNFKVSLTPSQKILVFSGVGLATKEVDVSGLSTVEVSLTNFVREGETVVVTALGIKRKQRAIGYAQDEVSGAKLTLAPSANVATSLAGRMAGVIVNGNDGVSGGTTRITIRGNNNLGGNNQPLYVVDGVFIENPPGQNNTSGRDWGSPINNINPYDIDKVTVLKGPAASALYGSRGQNGVILITTKKGSSRPGIGVDYNVTYQATTPYRYRDVQNKYGGGDIGRFLRFGAAPPIPKNADGEYILPSVSYYGSGSSWGPVMDGTEVIWFNGEKRPFSPQPNNVGSDFFENGRFVNHNVAVTGGNDKGSFRLSYTRMDDKGIFPNNTRYQNTVNFGGSLQASSKLKVDIAATYLNARQKNMPKLGDDNGAGGKNISYNWDRSYDVAYEKANYRNPDGTMNANLYPGANGSDGRGRGRESEGSDGTTYFWALYENNVYRTQNRLYGAVSTTYTPTTWLTLMGKVGTDNTQTFNESKYTPFDVNGLKGYYEVYNGTNRSMNYQFMATAQKDNLFKDFNASLAVGAERNSYYSGGLGAKSGWRNWTNPWKYDIFNSADARDFNGNNLNRDLTKKRLNSVFSFLDMSYKNFAYLQATARNDWSSTLPAGNNSYFYPSFSGSFILSEVLAMPTWVDYLKLKGAWAKAGGDVDPYTVNPAYEIGSNQGQPTASLPGSIPAQNIKPYFSYTTEIGAEVELLRKRIKVDFNYYNTKTKNQILSAPVPGSSGASNLLFNTGTLQNKGIELSVTGVPVRTKNLSWEVTFNMNVNRNRVLKLDPRVNTIQIGQIWGDNGPVIEVKEGEQYGTIMGWDYTYYGNVKTPENRIIDASGQWYVTTNNRVAVGNTTPKWTGGIVNTLSYKAFTLGAVVDMKIGGDMYYGTYVTAITMGQSPATLKERDGGGLPYTVPADPNGDASNTNVGNTYNVGVIKPGVYADGKPNTKVVHPYYKYGDYGGWGTNQLTPPGVYENTWIAMRELTLTYGFPSTLIKKTKIFQSLSLSVVGRNLFYFYDTAPDDINPQGSMPSTSQDGRYTSYQGMEFGSLPVTRSYGVTLRTTF